MTDFKKEFQEDPEAAYGKIQSIFNAKEIDLSEYSVDFENLNIDEKKFSEISIENLFERILFTTLRYVALDEDDESAIFTTCMDQYSPASKGLIHFIASSIAKETRTVLKKKSLQSQDGFIFEISTEKDPEIVDRSPDLFELDYTNFEKTKILKVYSAILYDALVTAMRGVKATRAVFVGVKDLSDMLDTDTTHPAVKLQVKAMADGVKSGKGLFGDAESIIKFIEFNIEPTEKTKSFVHQQYSLELGFPLSWFNGEGGSAFGDTGKSDEKHIRRACEFWFHSVLNPALFAVFGKSFSMKPDLDINEISTALSTVEMSGILTESGALDLLNLVGIKKESVNLSFLNKKQEENESGNFDDPSK